VEVVSLSSLQWPEDVLPNISPQMIKIGILFEQLIRASGTTVGIRELPAVKMYSAKELGYKILHLSKLFFVSILEVLI
jgi:hypothetical protein